METHLTKHLNIFLTKHKLINKNHHGGRSSHSTTSAITQIYNQLHKNKENNKISVVLTTDLSAAFDTIDTDILLKKT